MEESPLIVVVEDNPADIVLLRHALQDQDPNIRIQVLSDGEQALKFVEEQRFAQESVPCVILLDLHLPRRDGNDVLRAISLQPKLDHVRIAVWTTLASPEERERALSFGADLYQIKPTVLEGFWELAAKLIDLCHGRATKTTTP